MRGIIATADLRDDLIDCEILPKLVQGELVADPIPVDAGLPPPPPPPLSPYAQFELIQAEEGYTEPFILVSFPPRREEAEAQAEKHASHPKAVRFSELQIVKGAIILLIYVSLTFLICFCNSPKHNSSPSGSRPSWIRWS